MNKIFIALAVSLFALSVRSESYNQNPKALYLKCFDDGVMFWSEWENIPPDLGEPSNFEGNIYIENAITDGIEEIPLYFAHVASSNNNLSIYYWYAYFENPQRSVTITGNINGRNFINSVRLQCNPVFLPILER